MAWVEQSADLLLEDTASGRCLRRYFELISYRGMSFRVHALLFAMIGRGLAQPQIQSKRHLDYAYQHQQGKEGEGADSAAEEAQRQRYDYSPKPEKLP